MKNAKCRPCFVMGISLVATVIGNNPANAQTISGALSASDGRATQRPASYADRHEVPLRAGGAVSIAVTSSIDTMVYVYDPAGALIAQDDDSGEGLNPLVELVPSIAGTYVVEVTTFASGTSGDYSLSVTAAPEIRALQATEGQLARRDVRSRTRTDSFADAYPISLAAGDSRQVDVRAEIDTMVYVYDANGRTVAQDDDSGDGLNPRVRFASAGGGEYVIEVTTYGSDVTGPYAMTISELIEAGTDDVTGEALPAAEAVAIEVEETAPPLQVNETLGGGTLVLETRVESSLGYEDVLEEFGWYEVWDLTVPPGTAVEVQAQTPSGPAPAVRVLSPDGRVLAAGFQDLIPSLADTSFGSAEGGQYRITVSSGERVEYTLLARSIPASSQPVATAPVALVVGETQMVSAVEGDGYESLPVAHFELEEWSTVVVRASGVGVREQPWGFDVVSPAYGLSGLMMPLEDESGIIGVFDLPPGRHLLRAGPGSYRFEARVDRIQGVWEAGAPLVRGGAVDGTLHADREDGFATSTPRVYSDISCHPLALDDAGYVSLAVDGVGHDPALTVLTDLGEEPRIERDEQGTLRYVVNRAGTWSVCVHGSEWERSGGEYRLRAW